MRNKVSSDDIAPERIRVVLNDSKAKEDTKVAFDVFGHSEQTIQDIIGPFNEKIILITGKSVFQLIEENKL